MATILVINAGSSSIKLSLFEVAPGRALNLAAKAQMDGIGTQPRLRAQARDAHGRLLADEKYSAEEVPDVGAAMACAARWLSSKGRSAS